MIKKFFAIPFITMIALGFAIYAASPRSLSVDEIKEMGLVEDDPRFIEINGLDTHFRRKGAGDVLLLLHGTGSSTYTWRLVMDSLAKDFEVDAIDLPGFGLTQALNTQPTVEAYVEFIDDFMQTLCLDDAVFMGNSFGGEICWRLALKYPHRVRALILVDAAGYPHESPTIFKLLRVPLLGEMLAGINAKSIVRKNLQEAFFNDDLVTDSVVDNYYYRLLKKGNRETVLVRARMKADTLYKSLPQIRQPALIIWGEQDSWSPVQFGHRFAADIPNAKLAMLPNCGHAPQEEKPEEVARLVREFWREIRPR
jgi:pimeloyl-ACP methyl ester carboxylesterase